MFGGYHSKFKNIYGDPKKREECMDQIQLKVKGADPPLAAVNPKYLAVHVSCSAVDIMIRPLTEVGRVEATPKGIKVANGIPTCIEWCPRDDDLILVGQFNGEINMIRIPEEGIEDESISTDESELLWNCENGSILLAQWHPTIGNALLTACGSKFASAGSTQETHLIMWDTNTLAKVVDIPLFNCYLTSLYFNYNGSRLVCTDNGHLTRVIDLRRANATGDPSQAIVQEGMLHKKQRRQNVVYLKNNYLFSTGYSDTANREYALWADEDLSNPIELEDMDTNSGVNFPIYDADTNLLYVWGKGDSTIKFMEFLPDGEKPTIKFFGTFQSSTPQLSVIAMPKRGVDVQKNEVGRMFKFHNKGLCEFIPIICPRREKGFSEDVFPPTPSIEPSMELERWLQGEDADPCLISLDPGESGDTAQGPIHKPVKSVFQKLKEITELMNQFEASDHINSYKTLVTDIRSIIDPPPSTTIGSTNSNSNNNNGHDTVSNVKQESSLDKVTRQNDVLEKQGLLHAVDNFVNKDDDQDQKKDENVDAEWDD